MLAVSSQVAGSRRAGNQRACMMLIECYAVFYGCYFGSKSSVGCN